MKHLTRITALLLAVLMVITIIPATVFADNLDFSELDMVIEWTQTFLDSIDAEYEEWGYTQYIQANVDALRITYDEVIAAYPTLNDQTTINNYTIALDDALFIAKKYYDQTEWPCDTLLEKAEQLKELDGFNYTYEVIAYQNGTRIINYSYLYATTIDWVNKDTTVVPFTDNELRHTRRHIDERIRQIEQHIAFYNNNHYVGRGADYIDQETAIELGNIAIEITEGPMGGEYTPMLTAWRNLALNDRTNEYVAEYYSQLTRLTWYYPETSGYKPLCDMLLAMCGIDNRDVFDRWGYWVTCKEKQNYDHGANHDHFTDAYLKIIRIVIVWCANQGYLDIDTNFDTTALTAAITRAKAIRNAGYNINPAWTDEYRFEADFNEAINEAEYIIKWPYSLKEAQHAADRLNEYCDRIESQTNPADYTELTALLNQALQSDQSLYTAESVDSLNQMINRAQNAIAANYTYADQWRIDRIVALLQIAIDNLVLQVGDPAALQALREEAAPFYAIGADLCQADLWTSFSQACVDADALLTDADNSITHIQTDYDEAYAALKTALQPVKLNCRLTKAQRVDPLQYTTASYEVLEAAIPAASQDLRVWKFHFITHDRVTEDLASYNALGQALEQLVPAGSTGELAVTLAAAKAFVSTVDAGAYSTDSWAALTAAIQRAEELLAEGAPRYEQEVYDTANTRLTAARDGLVPVEEAPFRFEDVKDESKYYFVPVYWAYERGITSGVDASHFGPNATCTREQIATFLWKAADAPKPDAEGNPFTDVAEGKYYYKAVLWAYHHNPQITGGTTETTFGGKNPCKREQVVTFLWKASGAPEPETQENPFTDVRADKYYYKAVLWAVENGVTSGMTETTFGVGRTCTRAQIVTFLYAAYGNEYDIQITYVKKDV